MGKSFQTIRAQPFRTTPGLIVRKSLQLAIPRRVALQHRPPLLYQPGSQCALNSSCWSTDFHRTANCVLTVCLTPGGRPRMSPESFRRIRPFCKLPRVITFGPHGAREGAARVSASFQPVKNVVKVEQRPPSKLNAGSFVHIAPVDTGKHFPATASKLSLVFRNFPLQR